MEAKKFCAAGSSANYILRLYCSKTSHRATETAHIQKLIATAVTQEHELRIKSMDLPTHDVRYSDHLLVGCFKSELPHQKYVDPFWTSSI
jgi:hypothetical protein